MAVTDSGPPRVGKAGRGVEQLADGVPGELTLAAAHGTVAEQVNRARPGDPVCDYRWPTSR